MSFLTEYFDNYRQHPFKKTKPCQPENRYAPIEGRWLVPATGSDDGRRLYVENYVTLDLQKQWSEEDVKKFIKETMANLRGRSTYYNEYCAHLPEDLKTRPFVPRPKKQKPCPEKDPTKLAPLEPEKPLQPIDIQGSELMRTARALYDLDPDHLVLEPLATHHRILGYARPRLYGCGVSEYSGGVAYLGYLLMRDGLTRPCVRHNGGRPEWGLPPEAERQPLLDIVPFDGESLY